MKAQEEGLKQIETIVVAVHLFQVPMIREPLGTWYPWILDLRMSESFEINIVYDQR